ncbi:hypothetical protein DFH06DRAFT_1335683 [Mycena polygramma]|nr:hypothetical protein DFH06DRAFT_1335683 [Mycena polygramma]
MSNSSTKDFLVEKTVRMYLWGQQPVLNPTLLMDPECRTLRDNGYLTLWFIPNPTACTLCAKPILRHPSVRDGAFTILVSCPHGNRRRRLRGLVSQQSVAGIMPFANRYATYMGNLVVVKHPLDPSVPLPTSNADLPITDIPPVDFPFIDELVRRWCYHLYNLARKEDAAQASNQNSS